MNDETTQQTVTAAAETAVQSPNPPTNTTDAPVAQTEAPVVETAKPVIEETAPATPPAPTHSDTPAYEAPAMVVGSVETADETPVASNESLGDEVDADAEEVKVTLEDRMTALELHVANLFEAVKAEFANVGMALAHTVGQVEGAGEHLETAIEGYGAHLRSLFELGLHKVEGFFHSTPAAAEPAKSDDSETPAA